jgi:hypothetical protein
MDTKESIRKDILEKVKDYYNIAYKEKQINYSPGKDIIPFAGGSVIYQVCICKLLCSINSPELIP